MEVKDVDIYGSNFDLWTLPLLKESYFVHIIIGSIVSQVVMQTLENGSG